MSYPTIIRGMPDDQYHRHPAYGSTDLKRALRSPAHMLAAKRAPQVETPAKRDGKILHTCILEPQVFDSKYIVLPEDAPARPTDAMREAVKKGTANDSSVHRVGWWEAWDANNTAKTIITHELYEECRRISEAVREHPELRGFFSAAGGEAEQSVFAIDPETGLAVKCRNDYRIHFPGARIVLDLKSCNVADTEAFQRDAWNYGYFLSAAHYTDVNAWAGEPIDTFMLIAFEKEDATCFDAGHFPLKIYEVGQRGIDIGRAQQRRALALVKHCAEVGEYPAYDTEIEVLDPPSWAKV
jgi:exodeoxyribonuclease VIII